MSTDDRIGQILFILGEVNGKLGKIDQTINHHVDDDKERFSKIDESLEALHHKATFSSGFTKGITSAASVVGAVAGSLATLFFRQHN